MEGPGRGSGRVGVRAVRYDGQSVTVDRSGPEPAVVAGEVLLRPTLWAIDAADLAVVGGRTPFRGVLGRRCVGVVERAGDERGAAMVGRRFVVSPTVVDPSSDMARRGLAPHDPDRLVMGARGRDGVLSDLVAVPRTALHPVPEALSDEAAVFVLPVARAVHVSRLVRLEGKAYITVLGDTPDALLCAQVMARLNASVRVLGDDERMLGLCERWGLKSRPTADAGRRQDQDVVVDGICTPQSVALALALVRPRGTVILKPEAAPVPGGGATTLGGVDLTAAVLHEVEVVGARAMAMGEAVEMLASGAVDPSPLIGRRYGLDEAVAALRAAGEPGTCTVLIAA